MLLLLFFFFFSLVYISFVTKSVIVDDLVTGDQTGSLSRINDFFFFFFFLVIVLYQRKSPSFCLSMSGQVRSSQTGMLRGSCSLYHSFVWCVCVCESLYIVYGGRYICRAEQNKIKIKELSKGIR